MKKRVYIAPKSELLTLQLQKIMQDDDVPALYISGYTTPYVYDWDAPAVDLDDLDDWLQDDEVEEDKDLLKPYSRYKML